MGNLIFLVGAIALSIVGSVLLWLRYRKPTSFMSSIDDFQAEMSALSAGRPAPGLVPAADRPRPATPMGPQAGRPSTLSDRLRTARDRTSGRPTGLTAPKPGKARQGSTVRQTTLPPSKSSGSQAAAQAAPGTAKPTAPPAHGVSPEDSNGATGP